MMKIMRRIKTRGNLIMLGMLVPLWVPFKMRTSLTTTERILCPWEGRDMLKLKIKVLIFFYFKITILMQLRKTILMLIFCRKG